MAKTPSKKVLLEIGAGLVAAGAAAGYYFYASKKAKTHRKLAAGWAKSMKNEVVKEAKKLKKMDAREFAAIVDRVATAYQTVRAVDMAEVKRAANELKDNWALVEKEAKRPAPKKVAKKRAAKKK
jgi:hypothetical protein